MNPIKKTFFILILLTFTISCNKNEDETPKEENMIDDTCDISLEAINHFGEDAFTLTLRELYSDSSSIYFHYKDSINIPQDLFIDIQSKLGAIYDNEEGLQRDTVIDGEIHALPDIIDGELIVRVINQYEWVQEFMNGEEISSNQMIKETFDEYEITINFPFLDENEGTEKFMLNVKPHINLRNLIPVLESFEGVLYAIVNYSGTTGFSADINMELNEDTTLINFNAINGTMRKFEVYSDCTTSFVGN